MNQPGTTTAAAAIAHDEGEQDWDDCGDGEREGKKSTENVSALAANNGSTPKSSKQGVTEGL